MNLDGNLTDRPLTTNGLTFIDSHGSQRVDIVDNFTLTDYVSYNASFTQNGFLILTGQNGATGRNTVRADGQLNWDAAITKRFQFTENQNLEFRTEIFNIFNHPNFALPETNLLSPTFGTFSRTPDVAAGSPRIGSGGQRVIQFALKLTF